MKREILVLGFFFVIMCGLMIVFAPDGLSRIFVIVQAILMVLGFGFGIFRVGRFSRAFQFARFNIEQIKKEISTDDMWLPISRSEAFFNFDDLDRDFSDYKDQVTKKKRVSNGILPDIEDIINEDSISIKTWRNTISQLPETLTGVGILGTFVGLIIGVSSIGFSSVAAAVTSLQTLINGIEIAFYTSIVGIILSICFNLSYKFFWNIMLRDMFMFLDDFHKNVISDSESQMRELESKYYVTMLRKFGDEGNQGA